MLPMSKLRIAFLTNTSCRTNAAVLDRCAQSSELELAEVLLYDTRAELWRSPVKVVRQFGMAGVAERAFTSLLSKFWQPKRIEDETALDSQQPTALEICQRKSIPHTVLSDINQPGSIDALRELDLDLMVVCACKNILDSDALACPRLGVVNIHPSYLPDYRGPCPVFWALMHDEGELGVSIHQMTRRIDAGKVLWQEKVPTPRVESASDEKRLERQLFELASENLVAAVQTLQSKSTEDTDQVDTKVGSYFGYPSPADRRALATKIRKRGTG